MRSVSSAALPASVGRTVGVDHALCDVHAAAKGSVTLVGDVLPRRHPDVLDELRLPPKLLWHPPHGSDLLHATLQVDHEVGVVQLALADPDAFCKAGLPLAASRSDSGRDPVPDLLAHLCDLATVLLAVQHLVGRTSMASWLKPCDHPAYRVDEPWHDRIRHLDLAPQLVLQLQLVGPQQTCCKLVGTLGVASTLFGEGR